MSFRLSSRVLSNVLKSSIIKSNNFSYVSRILSVRAGATFGSRNFHNGSILQNSITKQVSESLKSEIEHESSSFNGFPEELTTFLETTGFEIVKTEGQALGEIIKKNEDSNEVIHVFFDVNQVVNINPELEDPTSAVEEEDSFDEDPENSFINLNIVVEKKTNDSAVAFDVLVGPQDGSTYVQNVTAYDSSAEALTESAEADQKREISYNGPSFTNLDESLQVSLESYLESRGVTEELYQFILSYGIYKENQEYLKWLEKLNTFFK